MKNLNTATGSQAAQLVNVDRLIVGEKMAGLECKTANTYNTDKWKDDNVPPYYHVLPGVMPDPDGSDICDGVIKHYCPSAAGRRHDYS